MLFGFECWQNWEDGSRSDYRVSDITYDPGCDGPAKSFQLTADRDGESVMSVFSFTWTGELVTGYTEQRAYMNSGAPYEIAVSNIEYDGAIPTGYEVNVAGLEECLAPLTLGTWGMVNRSIRNDGDVSRRCRDATDQRESDRGQPKPITKTSHLQLTAGLVGR
jgi:hypothetical protein